MNVIIRGTYLYYIKKKKKEKNIDFIREMETCEFIFQIVSRPILIRDDQRDLLDLTSARL